MRVFVTAIVFLFNLFYCLGQHTGGDMFITDARYFPTEKTIYYKLGESSIPIKVIQYGPVNDILCINIHDNEFTSVQAARQVLQAKGGTLVKIENNAERIVRFRFRGGSYAFDPNRIFSRTGVEETLKENGAVSPAAIGEVERFGQRLLGLIPDSISCVIALHNNLEDGYSVKSYLPGGDREKDASDVFEDDAQDADDIVFTTDPTIFQKMSSFGYNSILQHNQKAKKDGSLSVYFGERNRQYVNIETQHGRILQYQEMLEKLIGILSIKKEKPPPQGEEDSQ